LFFFLSLSVFPRLSPLNTHLTILILTSVNVIIELKNAYVQQLVFICIRRIYWGWGLNDNVWGWWWRSCLLVVWNELKELRLEFELWETRPVRSNSREMQGEITFQEVNISHPLKDTLLESSSRCSNSFSYTLNGLVVVKALIVWPPVKAQRVEIVKVLSTFWPFSKNSIINLS
jgi:hypothetical protein